MNEKTKREENEREIDRQNKYMFYVQKEMRDLI